MTVTIRTLTRRSSGRESVRATEVDKTQLVIGRATDCDINLPDLLVALRHARLIVSSTSFVVEAEGDNEFKFNGRVVRRAQAQFGEAAALQFGPYRLTFVAPMGRLTIDVERIEQARTEIPDPDKTFSLRGTWLSKRTTSYVFATLVAVLFLAFPIFTYATHSTQSPISSGRISLQKVKAGEMWSSGKLAGPHQRLARDCTSCHQDAFVSVRDQACLQCHDTIKHHADATRLAKADTPRTPFGSGLRLVAETFDKPAGRCADCHMEHNGSEGVSPTSQASCTSCHDGMSKRLPDAKVIDASDFGRNHPDFHPTIVETPDADAPKFTRVSLTDLDKARKAREQLASQTPQRSCAGFAVGQPNFRGIVHDGGDLPAEARVGDNSGLVFPHALHLDEKGCVAALAQQVTRQAAATTGLSKGPNYGKKLVCEDCHTRDERNVGYKPVEMEKNCSACHSLVFNTGAGGLRTLRHGYTSEVIAALLDFYQARVVSDATRPAMAPEARRRPGEATVQRAVAARETAFANAGGRASNRVQAIFSEGGACYGCHVITPPATPGGIDYRVQPVTLRDSFLPHGVFDHGAHEPGELTCDDCHNASTSRTSADVLMPHVQTCQSCHGGEHATALVQSSCVMCHGFHSTDPAAPVMKPVTTARRQQGATGSMGGASR